MIVNQLLSTDIFPLKKSDTCHTALVFMQDWNVFQLPVVDNGKLIGYTTSAELSELPSKQKIEKNIIPLDQLFAYKSQHLFEIIKLLVDSKFSCLAVCDQDKNYEGTVSWSEINQAFKGSSIAQPGSIIVLRMNPKDYLLSELIRIIEYNDCKVLNVFINSDPADPSKIIVSLKLNKQSIHTVIQTLERYQYNIQSIHQAQDTNIDLNDRYDWFIKYLNT